MRKFSTLLQVLFGLVLTLAAISSLRAEEGGSGHYFPGSMASFMDGVPSDPVFIARLNVLSYEGSIAATRVLPVAGLLAAGLDVKFKGLGLTFAWAPKWDLGDKWSYAAMATIPWLKIDVSADIIDEVKGIGTSDSRTGLGDMVLIPLAFNYKHSADLNYNFRITAYAPTGEYTKGRLANTGKNFWTIEPTAALIYLGQKNGREASLFFGVDFNQENDATNYKSGTQVHLDGTLAQHFPLWGGLAGVGATGFWYRQVTGDSGEGATFGDLKAEANGIGPVVSLVGNIGDVPVSAELKWLHEFENRFRPEGDIIFLKLMAFF